MDSLVAFSFHPAFYPPKSGGELRLYNIYKDLSSRFRITLITFNYPGVPFETVDHGPNFREIRVPKTGVSVYMHHIVSRLSDIKECSAVVTSVESRLNRTFRRIAREEIARADAVIFVYPYLYTVPAKWLRGKKVIYEAHNVEYNLMKASFSGSLVGRLMLRYVRHVEGSLLKKCDAAFSVSGDDRLELSRLYGVGEEKIRLSYNGIDLSRPGEGTVKGPGAALDPVCIFIGSYHPPNLEAVDVILRMAPDMPEVKFLIAGGVTSGFTDKPGDPAGGAPGIPGLDPIAWRRQSGNVWLAGRISDEEKERIYGAASIALNPMLSGSGTNIKMLDYMAAGLPIVTTPTGARGLEMENGRQAVVCSIDEFPTKIRALSADTAQRSSLGAEGRKLAEERYGWKSIADLMAADLESILHA